MRNNTPGRLILLVLILLLMIIAGCQNSKVTTAQPEEAVPSEQNQQLDQQEGEVVEAPVKPLDSLQEQLDSLTLEQKIGQLFIVGVEGTALTAQEHVFLDEYAVGGFIFYKPNITSTQQTIQLINETKKRNVNNPVPLWLSVDEEGGRVTRLPEEVTKAPSQQIIGALEDEELSSKIGQFLGKSVASFGMNMDFAPVLDVNSNPDNPVIGDRSLGENPELVGRLGIAAMKGVASQKVVPVIKHFPGHGDTSVDSHLGLPVITHSIDRFHSTELVPFKAAIDSGAEVIMVAHLLIPSIDPELPSSLSSKIIHDLLREELGFDGVVITDDMTMGAIAQHYEIGPAAIDAIEAGSNIVLIGHEVDKQLAAIQAVTEAVKAGKISEEMLNERVYAILKLKMAYGLNDEAVGNPDIEALNAEAASIFEQYGIN